MNIGIDIGGSHIAIALVNNEGIIVKKIEEDINPENENIAEHIIKYVDQCIEKLSEDTKIDKIGIAAPGNPKDGVITNLFNLNMEKIDFNIIKDKYNIEIQSINDAKAAGLAEKEYGSIKEYHDCVFLCLGTGIGGAVFLQNKLLQPTRNSGLELGHMIIEKNGYLCNCGKKGCFETYCSMKRFKDKVKKVLKNILQDDSIFDNVETEAIVIKELLEENIENKEIQTIITEYIDNLVVGLSNIIDIFEPEVICLGGSFVYFKEILYDKLIEQMQERRYVFNKESIPQIVLAKLKNDAGIIGATL